MSCGESVKMTAVSVSTTSQPGMSSQESVVQLSSSGDKKMLYSEALMLGAKSVNRENPVIKVSVSGMIISKQKLPISTHLCTILYLSVRC